jgi:hypothetical protein
MRLRIGLAFVLLATVGFVLGSCGGSDGGEAITGTRDSVTRPTVTATRPEVTVPTLPSRTDTSPTETAPPAQATTAAETTTAPPTTEETTTAETTTEETTTTETTTDAATTDATTTEAEPAPPAPPETVTVTQAPTTEPAEPATTAAETTPATTAVAGEPVSSDDDEVWAWIVLAAIFLAALGTGLAIWRRRRWSAATTWSSALADLSARSLAALDDVLAEGSVVTGQVQALAAEARSFEASAPDDASRADAARLRTRLDDLAAALEADRGLRLASPPPTPEQLSYSGALIRQQVAQLEGVLRPPAPGPSLD